MPAHLRDIVGGLCDRLTTNRIFGNPILTSLLILVCILLVSMWVYRDVMVPEDSDDTPFTLSLRLSGYLILLIMPIVFLHNKNLQKDYEKRGASELTAEVFRKGPLDAADGAGSVEVIPDVSDGGPA